MVGVLGATGKGIMRSCLIQSMSYVPGNTGHGGRVLVSMNSNCFYLKQFTMKDERSQDRNVWLVSGEFKPN